VRIAVINGPNLNLLGTREPALYGTETLADIESHLLKVAKELGVELTFSQHNGEGEIVEAVHALRSRADGALVNAGAYSHTSLAIRDALAGVKIPFVEVHLTNIYARVGAPHLLMRLSLSSAVLAPTATSWDCADW